ncbi:hypothetical protein FRC17_006109, partial [Serendipita sp. 399]
NTQRLARLLVRLNSQQIPTPGLPVSQGVSEKIDSLVIIERRADMVTPMLTQLTYEGLIDELIGVSNTYVELPANLVSPPAQANEGGATTNQALNTTPVQAEKKKKYQLSSSTDPLFKDLRDVNFAVLGSLLSATAKRLSSDYESRHNAQTVAQLKEFVGKLGSLQSEQQALRLHTDLAEMLMPRTRSYLFNLTLEVQQSEILFDVSLAYSLKIPDLLASYELNTQLAHIEDLVAEGTDRRITLRMMVLASIVSGGIKVKQLESLKRVFLQTYGYELLPTLLSLENLQLLQSNPLPPSQAHIPSMKLPFTALRKQLRLLIEESEGGSDAVPNDISYVYSGYAPLSVRLVQCVAQMNAVLASFNGPDGGKGKGKAKDVAQGNEVPKMNAHPIVGWKGFEDVVNTIPGPTIDITQTGTEHKGPGPSLFPKEQSTTTVVFFLGGCTFTEIAAIRWMAKRTKGRHFVIATTGVISGNSLIDSLLPVTKPKIAK